MQLAVFFGLNLELSMQFLNTILKMIDILLPRRQYLLYICHVQ